MSWTVVYVVFTSDEIIGVYKTLEKAREVSWEYELADIENFFLEE